MSNLSAPYVSEYAYRRSTGPVIGRFLTGLRDRKIEGVRSGNGRVIVPPLEYDPETGEEITEWVELGEEGVVQTWAWVHHPQRLHPLQHPFAWALIRLDGAHTDLLHAVDAGEIASMEKGMRVRVRWASETVGSIRDIECFEVLP